MVGNVGAENFQPLRGKEDGFDFDFKILTAFIRLGRAGPVRGRVPFILLFDFDFDFDFIF